MCFYRNLKRGEIDGIPVVLVINKEYQNIERKVSQDRDRNAFGEEVMGMFYKLFASNGIKYAQSSQAVIVSAARECWAKGHPLLHAISDSFRYGEYWRTVTSNEVFGDGYFSKASEIKDPAKAIAVSAMERKWKEEGKIALPGYFKKFSVLNAEREIERLADESSKESQKLNQRMPTALEQQSMKLLMGVLNAMAPEVAAVFSGSRTSYSVIISDKILGELKSGRAYRSRDVFLAQSLFVGDFAAGMATHLHEHAHIFGSDGSRGFTDALTEMFESIVRNREQFDAIEADWEVLRAAIQEERTHQKPQEDDSAKWIEDLSEYELRSLLLKVPPSTLKRLREVKA